MIAGGPDPLTVALQDLVAYPTTLAGISSRAQGVTVGRWVIQVHGRAGSFLLGDVTDVSYGMDLDYPDVRAAVYDVRDAIEDEFEVAWPAMTALQGWLGNELPGLGTDLAAVVAAAVVAAANDAAANGGDDGFADALDVAEEVAASSIGVLDGAAATMADLHQRQHAHVQATEALSGPVVEESRRRLGDLHAVMDAQPCGQPEALRQFTHFQGELAASCAALMAAVKDLVAATGVVHHRAAALAQAARSVLVDVRRAQSLVAAGMAAATIVDTLGFDAASTRWQSLSTEAGELLEATALRSPLRTPSVRARATARRD